MASKKPAKPSRSEDATQFLEQMLPKKPGGKGRAPRLPESFEKDAFRDLTRRVWINPLDVYLYPTEPDGNAATEAAADIDVVTALYLGQAAMWHAVARLLGKSGDRTEEQVNRILYYFMMVFFLECAPVLIGRGDTKLRKPEELAALIDRLEKRYWSELPEMKGRPGRSGKRADELPSSMFAEVGSLRDGFKKTRDWVLRPYRRLLTEAEWVSGQALERILDPDNFTDAVGRLARSKLKEFVEEAGLPVQVLGNPAIRFMLGNLLRFPPTEAALRFQAVRASLRYKNAISYREMKDAYYAWRKGR
jgi:hypothetical protein